MQTTQGCFGLPSPLGGQILLVGLTGVGTSSTVAVFTTIHKNACPGVSYLRDQGASGSLDSGDRFVIGAPGIYSLNFSSTNFGGAGQMAITRNMLIADVAANPASFVTDPRDILTPAFSLISGTGATASYLGPLNKGDIIRAHCSGGNSNSNVVYTRFSIVRLL